MSLPKKQEELAAKFMGAVFAAGIEQCTCKACGILRDMAKDFMQQQEQAPKIQKPKRT